MGKLPPECQNKYKTNDGWNQFPLEEATQTTAAVSSVLASRHEVLNNRLEWRQGRNSVETTSVSCFNGILRGMFFQQERIVRERLPKIPWELCPNSMYTSIMLSKELDSLGSSNGSLLLQVPIP